MKKNGHIQIRVDKALKLLLFCYCKKRKKNFTEFFNELLYFYLDINDLKDIYKYREELNQLQESGASEDYLNQKAEYFINELTSK